MYVYDILLQCHVIRVPTDSMAKHITGFVSAKHASFTECFRSRATIFMVHVYTLPPESRDLKTQTFKTPHNIPKLVGIPEIELQQIQENSLLLSCQFEKMRGPKIPGLLLINRTYLMKKMKVSKFSADSQISSSIVGEKCQTVQKKSSFLMVH